MTAPTPRGAGAGGEEAASGRVHEGQAHAGLVGAAVGQRILFPDQPRRPRGLGVILFGFDWRLSMVF
jgi:hypothetical protein